MVYELRADACPAESGRDTSTSGRKNTKGQPAGAGLSGAKMKSLEKELKRTGVGMDAVKARYQIEQPEQMTDELYQKVMSALAKTKTAA